MKTFFQIQLSLAFLLIISSCHKIKANYLDGIYECTVTSYGQLFGDSYDTTYQANLTIESEDGMISVHNYYGFEAPVKSLDKSNCYYNGSSSQWEEICITHKTVEFTYGHYNQNSSGQTSYVGTRK